MGWLAVTPLNDELLAVEAGYALSTAALAAALFVIERRAGLDGRRRRLSRAALNSEALASASPGRHCVFGAIARVTTRSL